MTSPIMSTQRLHSLSLEIAQQPTSKPNAPATSSSTDGFFQESPHVPNQFLDDVALVRTSQLFLPREVQSTIYADLSRFGSRVLDRQVLSWVGDAERHLPYIRTWDTWGKRKDELVTSEGWRKLQEVGIQEGIVAIAYEGKVAQYSRLYQGLKYHLWTGSCAYVTCPSAMQDGAAVLLARQLRNPKLSTESRAIFQSAFSRLTSRVPTEAWTSGQWMTERSGGSDVRNTETRAVLAPNLPATSSGTASDGSPLGPWLISGFKWFSSATDANMTVMLAKTGDSDRISAFFAPTRRRVKVPGSAAPPSEESELNGIQIQRLKSKLGTRAVPTAELVLKDMRAHMVGEEGKGTKEISTVLNITRVHNAMTSVGLWGRGLAISRAFSRVRTASGSLLMDIPAHVHGLAQQHVQYRANMLITYLVVALLGANEAHAAGPTPRNSSPPSNPNPDPNPNPNTSNKLIPASPSTTQHLLRLLTPVIKAQTALHSIAGLRFCMESLGGVGYLENDDAELNIARLFRDANVLAIWEGTTDIMAADAVRVLKTTSEVLDAFVAWIGAATQRWTAVAAQQQQQQQQQQRLRHFARAIARSSRSFSTKIAACGADELRYRGQKVLCELQWLVCAVLLVEDAVRDGNAVAFEVAGRWIAGEAGLGWTSFSSLVEEEEEESDWKSRAVWDKRIVFEAVDVHGLARGVATSTAAARL